MSLALHWPLVLVAPTGSRRVGGQRSTGNEARTNLTFHGNRDCWFWLQWLVGMTILITVRTFRRARQTRCEELYSHCFNQDLYFTS